jgi:hypothetical protein
VSVPYPEPRTGELFYACSPFVQFRQPVVTLSVTSLW